MLEIFEELKNNNSIIKKKEILTKHKDNKDFEKVLYLALSPRVKFYIKKIPDYEPKGNRKLEEVLPLLDVFSNREKTGHNAIDFLQELLSSLSENDAKVLIKIIQKDLKCGTNASIVNAIFNDIIEETPYMGASGYNIKNLNLMFNKSDFVYSEIKMDGQYANGIITKDEIQFESRQGNPTNLLNIFNNLSIISEKFGESVLNGELIVEGFNRYQANGIITSLLSIINKMSEAKNISKELKGFETKNNISFEEALERVKYIVWDIIPYEYYNKGIEYKVPRHQRLEKIKEVVEFLRQNNVTNVDIIDYRICNTKEEVFSHFLELLGQGDEGTIVKTKDGYWAPGKPKTQMKFKLELDLDLIITGLNEGSKNTKFEGKYSSIEVQSSCGKLITNPAGINEEMVDYITENAQEMIGKIVTVLCSGISQDAKGNYSLLHPRFKGFRDDKITLDSLEDCLRKEAEAKGLSKV